MTARLGPGADLPVDPERLRREFPSLRDEDLEAYVAVTRRILGCRDASERARLTRSVLERGREALAQGAGGDGPQDAEVALAVRYVRALEAMQRPVRRSGQ